MNCMNCIYGYAKSWGDEGWTFCEIDGRCVEGQDACEYYEEDDE